MNDIKTATYTGFVGVQRIASGDLKHVVAVMKQTIDAGTEDLVLVFEDDTGTTIDLLWNGSRDEVLARIDARQVSGEAQASLRRSGPGRPRLGVVPREVTLLPRHWDWLAAQPGGASVTLRKLVEKARHENEDKDHARRTVEAAYRFMYAMAGDRENFEEVSRALFAKDFSRIDDLSTSWPHDIREYALQLVDVAMHADQAACWGDASGVRQQQKEIAR